MINQIDFKSIADAALMAADMLLSAWLPQGKRHGHEYQALNPTRADSKIGSFSINLNTGAWADFATDDVGGDLISLYAYLNEVKMGVAARVVAEQLRMDVAPPAAPVSPAAKAAARLPPENKDWQTVIPVPDECLRGMEAAHPYREKDGKTRISESIYRDEAGRVLGMVVRFPTSDGGKDDIPRTFGLDKKSGLMEWRWKVWDGLRPIYGLNALAAKPDAPVLIVEGEKCKNVADASGRFDDFAVVSWAGGSNAWQKTDWARLGNGVWCCFPMPMPNAKS